MPKDYKEPTTSNETRETLYSGKYRARRRGIPPTELTGPILLRKRGSDRVLRSRGVIRQRILPYRRNRGCAGGSAVGTGPMIPVAGDFLPVLRPEREPPPEQVPQRERGLLPGQEPGPQPGQERQLARALRRKQHVDREPRGGTEQRQRVFQRRQNFPGRNGKCVCQPDCRPDVECHGRNLQRQLRLQRHDDAV